METSNKQSSYLSRLVLGFSAAFGLVFLAAVAVGGKGHDLLSLSAGAIVAVAVALPAAALVAWLVHRSGTALVLWAQGLTVVVVGLLNFLA